MNFVAGAALKTLRSALFFETALRAIFELITELITESIWGQRL